MNRAYQHRLALTLRAGRLGLILFAAVLPFHCASAYGNAGHETVGEVAAHYLEGSRAEKEVGRLLWANETLGRACTWADRAKLPDQYLTEEMKAFIADNPSHHKYHYCDVPFQQPAYREGGAGTSAIDIVHLMRDCIDVLQNPQSANPHKLTPRVALMLLAHLVGDLHQPFHVGTSYIGKDDTFVDPDAGGVGQEDAGGNYLRINARTNLHGYWDTLAVKKARDKAPDVDFTGYLLSQDPPRPEWKTAGAPRLWPELWANETLHRSASCYEGIRPVDRVTVPPDEKHVNPHDEWRIKLPPGYDDRAGDLVEVQLAKAGYRLAELLKAIWPD